MDSIITYYVLVKYILYWESEKSKISLNETQAPKLYLMNSINQFNANLRLDEKTIERWKYIGVKNK